MDLAFRIRPKHFFLSNSQSAVLNFCYLTSFAPETKETKFSVDQTIMESPLNNNVPLGRSVPRHKHAKWPPSDLTPWTLTLGVLNK